MNKFLRYFCVICACFSMFFPAGRYFPSVYGQEDSKEAESLFVAQRAFDDGFNDVALSLLERYISNYPGSERVAEAKLLIGRCFFQENRYLEALKQFEELLPLATTKKIQDGILYWMAEVHFRGNNFARAAGFYKQVVEGWPGSPYVPSAYYSLGWCLIQQQRYAEALESLTILEERFPGEQQSREAVFKIIECLYNLKDYAGLRDRLKTYISNSKNDTSRLPHLYYYLAEAQYYLDNYPEAVEHYERVIQSADDGRVKTLAGLGLGWSYLKLKRFPEAQARFAAIIPDNLDKQYQEIYYMGRAMLSYETGRFEEAQRQYEKLKTMTSDQLMAVQASLGKADSLYSRGLYAEAVREYREIAEQSAQGQLPREMTDRLHHSSAWAYLKGGQFKEAIAEFQKIVNQSEERIFKVSALCQIGDAYQDSGDNAKARETYEKILKEFPDGFYADYVQYQLGITLVKLGEYDAAIVTFVGLKKNFPSSKLIDDAQYALGLAYFQKKDYAASLEIYRDFEKDFRESELYSQAMYLYGTSFFNSGEYGQAIEVFKNIIRDPKSDKDMAQKAEYEIADCYYQMGNEKEAMSRFNQLRVKYPDSSLSAEIMWWLGEYYYRKDELTLAIRYFSSLIHDFKGSTLIPNAYYALGSIFAEEGKFEEAVDNFKTVTAMSAAELGGQAVIATADIYARQDKFDIAAQAYRKAAADYPQLSHIIYPKLGDLYVQQRRYADGLESYAQSLELVPLKELPEIHLKMAEAYQSQGKTNEAVEHYLKITYLFPEDRELGVKAMLRVAKIYGEQGKTGEARAFYEKIAALDVVESKYARERIAEMKE